MTFSLPTLSMQMTLFSFILHIQWHLMNWQANWRKAYQFLPLSPNPDSKKVLRTARVQKERLSRDPAYMSAVINASTQNQLRNVY